MFHKFVVSWPMPVVMTESYEKLCADFLDNISKVFEGNPGLFSILEIRATGKESYAVTILCTVETARNILDYEIDIGPHKDSTVENWMGVDPMTVDELIRTLTGLVAQGTIAGSHEVFVTVDLNPDGHKEPLVRVQTEGKNYIVLEGEE